ncbi:hypothetical protein HCDG_03778 [Histoplasma capsulatum H143]|uniref:DUF3237 domain-containing protein n=1 Tax=Ajellomyces capsulatus (strain H143) TaxID=544712 RepID=C6HCM9_AJECH|nr:hypothetical protein HCDG_03778 [Histoplasma capsulatum H143]
MAHFPSLEPAFTMQVKIKPPTAVGSFSRGTKLMVTPMISGNIESESTFSPALSGEFVGQGNDYIHVDPDGEHLRLDAHGVIKTRDDVTIYLNYTGIVDMTPAVEAIMSGESESMVTSFGNSFIHLTFETGDEKYASLETGVWVGGGHFIYEKGEAPIVEYKVSKVTFKS